MQEYNQYQWLLMTWHGFDLVLLEYSFINTAGLVDTTRIYVDMYIITRQAPQIIEALPVKPYFWLDSL